MEKTPARVVMVVAPTDYMEEELDHPLHALQSTGFDVLIASTDRQRARGSRGGSVKPDILVSEASLEGVAGLVFVGGFGARALVTHPLAINLAARGAARGLVLGGICFGAAVLAAAGCLRGKRGTTYAEAKPYLEAGGATYTGRGVEVDGNVVTAAGPEESREFGRALVQLLRGRILDPSALVP